MDLDALKQWIGRTEDRRDTVTAAPVAMMSATLDRDDPHPRPGTPLPALGHWLYFTPQARHCSASAHSSANVAAWVYIV